MDDCRFMEGATNIQPFHSIHLIALIALVFASKYVEPATICAHSGHRSIGLVNSTHDTGKRLNPISRKQSYPHSAKKLDKEETFYYRSSRYDGQITNS